MNDTIFARATAAGRAAVAIVRISGPGSARALSQIAGVVPSPRLASVRSLRTPLGELIDRALVLWMPGPGSFTGEDSVELQVHGGPAVLEELSATLQALGLRPAEAGEFSRRAFMHGKLDLLQAEAVADLVDAETVAQKRQALTQMEGAVGRRFQDWRDQLVGALALIEAEIDFPDEDLPGALAEQARPLLKAVKEDLSLALTSAERGQRVRDGYRVALIGRPNAGKSSLFNALLARDAAIVSRHPGTTRDVVEVSLQIAGYAVTLADTAGVRSTSDEVEQEGVRRAQAWAEGAAWRLMVVDPLDPDGHEELAPLARTGDEIIFTKADLPQNAAIAAPAWVLRGGFAVRKVSSVTGQGVAELLEDLGRRLTAELAGSEIPTATRARHQHAMVSAHESLIRAAEVLESGPERAAEDVRRAVRALHSVIGGVDSEAVLDRVFSSFCIGK